MVLSLFKTSNQTNSSKKNRQAGQVGITTLLIMIVILSIAISLSQRTILEQDIALTQEKATRVFNAAEYGVEEALYTIAEEDFEESDFIDGYLNSTHTIDNLTINSSIQKLSVFEMYVEQGSVVEIPLDDLEDGDELKINWWYQEDPACDDDDDPPALIISIYGDNKGRHFGYDPCGGDGESRENNNFEDASASSVDDYLFAATITLELTDELVRVTPLYNSSKIQISANEGAISEAQFEANTRGIDEDAGIAQALRVLRSMPAAPSFMDYTLVSGGSLSK